MSPIRLICPLALVGILWIGCHGQSSTTPDQLEVAVDSVEVSLWRPAQIAPDDTLPHSRFYDSVFNYVMPAVAIERDRRLWMDSLLVQHPLRPDKLRDPGERLDALASLDEYERVTRESNHRIDSLMTRYDLFLKRTLRVLFRDDSEEVAKVKLQLLKRTLFVPDWRTRFDSLENRIVSTSKQILSLVDSVAPTIQFDLTHNPAVLRFETEEEADAYMRLRNALDSLVKLEVPQAAESNWGRVK